MSFRVAKLSCLCCLAGKRSRWERSSSASSRSRSCDVNMIWGFISIDSSVQSRANSPDRFHYRTTELMGSRTSWCGSLECFARRHSPATDKTLERTARALSAPRDVGLQAQQSRGGSHRVSFSRPKNLNNIGACLRRRQSWPKYRPLLSGLAAVAPVRIAQ
jgi:hypothetical protein